MSDVVNNTLNHISIDMNHGLSVFYVVTYQCIYSLGYLPEGKSLSAGNVEIVEELHRERILAVEWLLGHGKIIQDKLAPKIIQICREFAGYMYSFEDGEDIVATKLIQSLEGLRIIVDAIDMEYGHLQDWLKRIYVFHREVMDKCQANPLVGCYSWQDAADKLEAVLQVGDKIAVIWKSMSILVDRAMTDLEQAKTNVYEIVRDMYCEAAAKQWEDVGKLAEKLVALESNA